jgi:phytanoyl-CoA hydroxylase
MQSSPSPGASPHGLTAAERAEYRERGFFVRRALFAEHELAVLRAAVEEIHERISVAARPGLALERIDGRRFQRVLGSIVKWEWDEAVTSIRSMEPVHPLSPPIDALIDDARLCAPARGLIDAPGVSLFTDKLNFKRPRGSPFPWHQDAPYWAFGCNHLDRLASVQIYLDEATPDNGCLWVIPGSHRLGHVPALSDRGVLGRLYSDIGQIEGMTPMPLPAPAGSAIFFDGYIVHGSQTNRTLSDRRALVFTYQPPGLPLWNSDTVRVPVRERTRGATGDPLPAAPSL